MMTLHIILHILIFTTTSCFGYKKLKESVYSDYKKGSEKGAVFMWAPTQKVDMVGISGTEMTIFDDLHFNFNGVGQDKGGSGLMVCKKISAYTTHEKQKKTPADQYRVIVKIQAHGYKNDYIELDEFAVTTCIKSKLIDMIKVSRSFTNEYTLTFKDTNDQCFERNMQVTEDVLMLSIFRDKPDKKDCKKLDVTFQSQTGLVVPDTWLLNGHLFHGDDVEEPNKALEGLGRQDAYLKCRKVEIEDQKFNVAHIYWSGVPLDRLIVNTCSDLLISSIYKKYVKRTGPDSYEIKITYKSTGDKCYERIYKIKTEFIAGIDFMKHLTVHRLKLQHIYCFVEKVLQYRDIVGVPLW